MLAFVGISLAPFLRSFMRGWLLGFVASPPIESSPWLERNPQGPQRHLTTCPLRLRSPWPSVAAVCRGCAVPVVAVPVRRRRRRCRVLPPVAARLPPLRRCGCGRSVAAPPSSPVAAPLLSLVAAVPSVAVARGVLGFVFVSRGGVRFILAWFVCVDDLR